MSDYDYHAHQEIAELRQRLATQQRAAGRSRVRSGNRIEELEGQVAFLALMNRALLEVLVKAELCDVKTLSALMEAFDAADGVVGDGLDPDELAKELGVEKIEIDKKKAFRESFAKSMKRRRPSF